MKKQLIYAVFLATFSVVCLFLTSEKNADIEALQIYDVFDTYCDISVSGKNAEKALEKCNSLLHRYHALWNVKDENSEITRLNNAAGISEAEVSGDTLDILELSKKYSMDTNGFFDVTVGCATELWNISDLPRVPTPAELTDAIHKTGFAFLEIDKKNSTAYLTKQGVKVDLGAIAKGYATDKLVEILKKEGVRSALINLGGNVYAMGKNSDNMPYSLGISDPMDLSMLVGTVKVSNKAVVTSAGNLRFFEADGKNYGHILNPFTASPANSDLLQVTIIGDSATVADMLSTACYVVGYSQSLALIKEFGVEAIFVTRNETVHVSEGIADKFEHDNEKYEYN